MPLDDVAPDVDIAKELQDSAPPTPMPEVNPEEVKEPLPEEQQPLPEEQPKPEKKEEVIPLKTFLEEKAERKALQKRLEEIEAAQRAALEKKPEEAVPSFEDNPAAHLLHNQRQVTEQLQTTEQKLAAFEQQQAMVAQQHEIMRQVSASEESFKASSKVTDYDDAIKYVKRIATETLADFIEDPAQRDRMVSEQIMQMSAAALSKGKSPAEYFYNHAKRIGFQGKRPAQNQVQQIQQGLAAAKSLGSGSAETPITPAVLENMSDDDMEKLLANDSEWNKLKGMMR